jgi:DNA-binding XRE family transcriptional regulator
MTGKQLRVIRGKMGLTQAKFAEKIGMTGNSVARMERGEMIITKTVELLISFVAREAGIGKASHSRPGSRGAADKRKHGANPRHSKRSSRER